MAPKTNFNRTANRTGSVQATTAHATANKNLFGQAIDERLADINAQTGAVHFLHTDRQNSVVAISDAAGNPVARRGYGTYGETDPAQMTGAGAASHPFGYTGRRWDPDLGLYYYRARWYDPQLGTFLQTDPIGAKDYINLYSYVGLEPGNATDPSGKIAFVPIAACLANPACIGTAGAVAIAAGAAIAGSQAQQSEQYDETIIVWGERSEVVTTTQQNPDGTWGTPSVSQNETAEDRATLGLTDDGKVHGALPDVDDIPEDMLEETDRVLGESIETRSRENERFPRGNPNGNEQEQRDFQKFQQHQERIAAEQRLRERVRRRLGEGN